MTDRLCIDCKFHEINYLGGYFGSRAVHWCRRMISVKTSPVDGIKMEVGEAEACEVERAGIFDGRLAGRPLCGPDGMFWQGKSTNGS